MKYKITHVSTYDYTDTVPVCQNEVHLTPRTRAGQVCTYHRLVVRPTPSTTGRRMDYFGNPVNYFDIHEGHRKLVVSSVSNVTVTPQLVPDPASSPAWEMASIAALSKNMNREGLDAMQFCFDSHHVRRLPQLLEYAKPSFPPQKPVLEGALELTARIYRDFKYDPAATTVSTPLEEVFQLRRGVCQDLAHVQIGCFRSLGLAARYVSGYLRTVPPPGKPKLRGVDGSHAWVALHCGNLGWVDLDPTNNIIPSIDHVTVAWGRDYSDVCPINGMFVGGGKHTMHVGVDVAELSEGPADYMPIA